MILIKTFVPILLKSDDWQIKLLNNWHQVVGNLKTRVRLEKIHDTTVIIGVYEAHWMQELYLLSNVLLNSINKVLIEPKVTAVKFKIVEESKKQLQIPKFHQSKPYTFRLNQAQKRALTPIKDKELASLLEKFLIRCLM